MYEDAILCQGTLEIDTTSSLPVRAGRLMVFFSKRHNVTQWPFHLQISKQGSNDSLCYTEFILFLPNLTQFVFSFFFSLQREKKEER